ncbi:MAG: DNA alkylation repair protein, partial [Chitinophagales bacterium]
MNDYINTLEAVFLENANTENAAKQAKYMKNNFAFYGINSPTRKLITRPFLVKDALPAKEDLEKIIKYLWQKPQREFQYFALELALKYKKQIEEIKEISHKNKVDKNSSFKAVMKTSFTTLTWQIIASEALPGFLVYTVVKVAKRLPIQFKSTSLQ